MNPVERKILLPEEIQLPRYGFRFAYQGRIMNFEPYEQ